MVRFSTGEEKEIELWCRKCKAFTDEKHGCRNCKKCKTMADTKMKPDWVTEWKQIRDSGVDAPMSEFYDKVEALLLKQEEQHKEELEKSTEGIRAIYLLELNQLKLQHRAELEGKFMISAFDAHYLAGVILSELGHPIFEKSHAVARNMQKNREALCEMFLALIEQHKMQFSQKEIDFVTNLLEQKGK